MSDRLRHLSARPQLLVGSQTNTPVDNVNNRLGDGRGADLVPANQYAPWLGRARIVAALPIDGGGPRRLRKDTAIRDHMGHHLADPQGNVIGRPGVVVIRMLDAGKVGDTRRL